MNQVLRIHLGCVHQPALLLLSTRQGKSRSFSFADTYSSNPCISESKSTKSHPLASVLSLFLVFITQEVCIVIKDVRQKGKKNG